MSGDPAPVGFTGLVDLAAAALGGRALGASDDFFAAADNLVQPGRGVFIEGKYTDRGKWMDGWESRRRRAPRAGVPAALADCDWCVVELGAPGQVLGLDIDTNHFVGNHPPFASVEGLSAPRGTALDDLAAREWIELLAQAPLRPGAQNLFAARPRATVSHVRLNIFPDGGVARLRVFGRVTPPAIWETAGDAAGAAPGPPGPIAADLVDLVAVKNGGLALACSDAFFGPMNNLLLPGRALDMSGGWETRRRRGPGHDWILVRLAAPGAIAAVEIDTNHFKGNHPDRCSLETIHAPDARITDLIASTAWSTVLPETRLRAHERHVFDTSVAPGGGAAAGGGAAPATHARLNVFPDGGVSRLRLWGRRHG